MISPGTAITLSATAEIAMSSTRLMKALSALQRHVVEVDDRHAVEILEPRAQRDELQQVGHDLDVDALAAGRLDEVEQLHVLFERQRDVEVVDLLAGDDLGGLGERAEQRQPAVAEVIAAGAIVDEADDLVAELAVLEDASATMRPRSPAPAIRMRRRPTPASQRRSSASRMNLRDR